MSSDTTFELVSTIKTDAETHVILAQLQRKFNELQTTIKEYEETVQTYQTALLSAQEENRKLQAQFAKTSIRKTAEAVLSNPDDKQVSCNLLENNNTNLIEVCPLEVWEKVFDYVTTPKDRTTCSRLSKVWNTVLAPKKTVFLFEEVLPILIKKLSKPDVLTCRGVCLKWKTSVDNTLQTHPFHFGLLNIWDFNVNLEMNWLKYMYTFDKLRDVHNFLKHVASLSKHGQLTAQDNPFLTRCIFVQDRTTTMSTCEPFWRALIQLLKVVGSHIWHCNFEIDPVTFPHYRFEMVQSCIKLMPNLKTMWLYSSCVIQKEWIAESRQK